MRVPIPLVLLAAIFALLVPGSSQAQSGTEPCPVCGYPLPWDARVCPNCGSTFEFDPVNTDPSPDPKPDPKPKPPIREVDPVPPRDDRPVDPEPPARTGRPGRIRPNTPDELGQAPPSEERDPAVDYGYSLLRVEDPQFLPEESYRITAGVDHGAGHHLGVIGYYHGATDIATSTLWGRLEYGIYDHALLHVVAPFKSVTIDPESPGELESGQGPGDVSVGLRWGFLHAPDIVAGVDISAPTGDEIQGRGRASTAYRALAIYADHFPEFSIAWNLGMVVGNVEREYSATSTDPAQTRTIVEHTIQAGVAVQRPMGAWTALFELYAEYEDFGFRTWGDNQQYENFLLYGGPGFRWRMSGGQHVTIGALKGMSSQADDFTFHLRVAFEF